ncbi:D-3-phosphoglycerate dehydrogenase [Mesorhizobium sp. J18]|uniref:hydroxyacid dehydrogenase n=1 Tax=Mesorhizobium sp. J18 TaxID=935263 RepID=UPI00119C5388|nr:hydroxyacid dehydrogenase [Mesorhizobium sp. J18]TWG96390.1 D-3-phosphoglycerate dehydrogenase [Mesorhizobium sp. J18]
MSGKFRVGYLDEPPHPQFLREMENASEVELVRIDTADGQATDVIAQLQTCQGYYCRAARDELPKQWHVTDDLLAQLPKLLVVSSYGAGYDTINIDDCTARGVAVCNQASGNAEAVAEHALGMILVLLKRIPQADRAVRVGKAARRNDFFGGELFGRTVGIVGLGHIGSRTAELVKFFNCRVLAYDPYVSAEVCARKGVEKVEFAELVSQSDIISVHCPLTDETRGLFDAAAFSKVKDGSIFVSTARGGIHDENALYDALVSGRVHGAGLDVWVTEPPPVDHKLLSHPAVIASSHTAGVTNESRTRVTTMAADTFIQAARGKLPPRIVNEAVAPVFEGRLKAAFDASWKH